MLERVQKALNQIPGYTAYQSKERRRDDDRAVRNQLADELDATAAQVEAIGRDLANERKLNLIQPIESLFHQIGHLANRVRTAPSGYTGLFDEREVDELALDQLRRFDEQAATETTTLAELVTALQRQVSSSADPASAIASAVAEVSRLSALWDGRGRVLETARPSPESELVALLDPASPPTAAPKSVVIDVGDAVAVAGKNAIVTATLRVDASPHEVLLGRLDNGPDWLLVLQGTSPTVATVVDASGTERPSGTILVEGQGRSQATDRTGAAAEAAVAVTIVESGGESDGESTIWVGLDWGKEQRQYRGSTFHPSDLETFGRPTA
jgi:hypothetical protein